VIVLVRVNVRFNASIFASADGISTASCAGCSALHSARRCILALVHGILGAVLNGLVLLTFATLGLNGLARYEAKRLDEAVRNVVFRVGVEHVALVALVENHHVTASRGNVLQLLKHHVLNGLNELLAFLKQLALNTEFLFL